MTLRLNAVTWGFGTPSIVLLHGLGDGAFVWNPIAPRLAAHMTVIAIELRGHGDSPRDPQAHYEPATYAEDVLEMMKFHVGGRPTILIGHSLGAEVAIHVAFMARAQVSALALIDGGPGLNQATLRHIQQQFLTQPWFHDSVDSFATELERRHPLSTPQLLRGIAEGALRPLPAGGYELKCDRRVLSDDDEPDDALLWKKLRSYDGPVLVIRGAGSAVLSRAGGARMANELPDCRLETVSSAGHTVMLDNPDGLLLVIEGFLSEISCNTRTHQEVLS